MLSPFRSDNLHGLVVRETLLVAAFAAQSVIDIGNRHHPRRQGDLIALQTVGIALTIPFFMVGPGDGAGHGQEGAEFQFALGNRQGRSTHGAVIFDQFELFLGQLTFFFQD